MYSYIKGDLEENTAIGRVGELHSKVKVYTYYHVREDNISLYGFNTKQELRMFELLISVSGIGSKSAMNMLSNIEPSTFAVAVVSGDIKKITGLPGIGNKTAQRLVLELKDKLKAEQELTNSENLEIEEQESNGKTKTKVKPKSLSSDASDALQILGYNKRDIDAVLEKIDMSQTTEEIIKQALKML